MEILPRVPLNLSCVNCSPLSSDLSWWTWVQKWRIWIWKWRAASDTARVPCLMDTMYFTMTCDSIMENMVVRIENHPPHHPVARNKTKITFSCTQPPPRLHKAVIHSPNIALPPPLCLQHSVCYDTRTWITRLTPAVTGAHCLFCVNVNTYYWGCAAYLLRQQKTVVVIHWRDLFLCLKKWCQENMNMINQFIFALFLLILHSWFTRSAFVKTFWTFPARHYDHIGQRKKIKHLITLEGEKKKKADSYWNT